MKYLRLGFQFLPPLLTVTIFLVALYLPPVASLFAMAGAVLLFGLAYWLNRRANPALAGLRMEFLGIAFFTTIACMASLAGAVAILEPTPGSWLTESPTPMLIAAASFAYIAVLFLRDLFAGHYARHTPVTLPYSAIVAAQR